MMFSRDGFLIRKTVDGLIIDLYKVTNDYDTCYYKDGKWLSCKTCWDLGMSDEYDHISEETALKKLALTQW